MASLMVELSGLFGFDSPDICSGLDACFLLLDKRFAFICEWPFRPAVLSPNEALVRRSWIAVFIRICLPCDSATSASCNAASPSCANVSDSVEPNPRAESPISRAASSSCRKLMPATNKSRESCKGFRVLKAYGDQGRLDDKIADRGTNCKASFNYSGPASDRYRPSRRGVFNYPCYDLAEDASEFARAERGCAEAALAVFKNRQPPTAFFNNQSVEHAYG